MLAIEAMNLFDRFYESLFNQLMEHATKSCTTINPPSKQTSCSPDSKNKTATEMQTRLLDDHRHGINDGEVESNKRQNTFLVVLAILLILVIIGLSVLLVIAGLRLRDANRRLKPVRNISLIKPQRLSNRNIRMGDHVVNNSAATVIGLFSPASSILDSIPNGNVTAYKERLDKELKSAVFSNLTLEIKYATHAFNKDGYLAGTDAERRSDIHELFSDTSVKIMMANRGGWGCNRIIDQLDYNLIKKNPKIVLGFSDLTGCLNAIFFTTGIVTFHGPMGLNSFVDNWPHVDYNLNTVYMRKLLLDNEKVLFQNPPAYPITTIKGGKARGRLVGGNLSVFAAMIGSQYLPPRSKINMAWEDTILFFEDVHEAASHIDRYMTQLQTSGILDKAAGFVFGTCADCSVPPNTQDVLQVLKDHIKDKPSFSGMQFGHDGQQFTFPIGVQVEIDADKGTIQMLESALSD